MTLLVIFSALLIVALALFYFSLLLSLRREAPFVPTGRRELRWILREVARVKSGEVFYDLGSGDGRVVRAAARLGARAAGFEQSWVLTWWARVCTRLPHASRATFVHRNYLKENLREADVIFCYLMPKAMEHLKEKFERELRPGTRVISRAFPIHGWIPVQKLKFRPRTPPVYLYVKR